MNKIKIYNNEIVKEVETEQDFFDFVFEVCSSLCDGVPSHFKKINNNKIIFADVLTFENVL